MYISFLSGKINDSLPLWIALSNLYGIGRKTAIKILANLKINKYKHMKELEQSVKIELSNYIKDNYLIELDLKRDVRDNILLLKEMGSLRGRRLSRGLPVRGQRTSSNAVTARKLNKY